MVGLKHFLAELRTAGGREGILSLTLRHLRSLIPLGVVGFYFPNGPSGEFVLETPLPAEESAELNRLMEQAIDSRVFGWALKHFRPAALRCADGQTTLVLAALRNRQRVLGMFVGTLSVDADSTWDANLVVLATHLDCAAEAILTEELSLELQNHNRKLDSLVQQRTQQFLEAKETAEMANRAKSAFLATISHELRTPLNAILGYTQLLLGDSLSPDQLDQLQTISQSAEHLLALINDLLDLSKAESSAIELVPRRIELQPLVQETIRIVRPRAEDKSLMLLCAIEPALPRFITVDPKRLKQILLNLLTNAIKFTDHGFVHLKLKRKNDAIRFTVSDTGCGIAAEDLPKLFQPFQQVGNAAQHAEGTGLGLSISKRVLELMQIDIQVRSELGKGSSFWFDFPFDPAETELMVPMPPPAPAEPPPRLILPWLVLDRLKALAASGDVLALQEHIEQLLTSSPPPQAGLSKLLQLAVACKVKAVRDLLDTYESDHLGGG